MGGCGVGLKQEVLESLVTWQEGWGADVRENRETLRKE